MELKILYFYKVTTYIFLIANLLPCESLERRKIMTFKKRSYIEKANLNLSASYIYF